MGRAFAFGVGVAAVLFLAGAAQADGTNDLEPGPGLVAVLVGLGVLGAAQPRCLTMRTTFARPVSSAQWRTAADQLRASTSTIAATMMTI